MRHDNIMQVLLTSEIYNNSIIEKDNDNNTLLSLTTGGYLLNFRCWVVRFFISNFESNHWDKKVLSKNGACN